MYATTHSNDTLKASCNDGAQTINKAEMRSDIGKCCTPSTTGKKGRGEKDRNQSTVCRRKANSGCG